MKFKPLNDNYFVKYIDMASKLSDVIYVEDSEYKMAYFEVIAKGSKTKYFDVGNIVVTNMFMADKCEITDYFDCDDCKYYVLKEKDIYLGFGKDEKI